MEKPSLEIGSSNWAIKEGELLGYNRVGNDYLPIPITMTRASLGTRVNPEGLIEDVELLGSEEIDCGDFSCETPSTYWTEVGNSSLVVGDYQGRTNVANINILGTANSDRIKQDFTYYNGATYFISVDVYLVSGSFRVDTSNSIVPYDFISTTTTGSWQTLTGYFTAVSSSANDIWLRSTQDVSQFYISNVSVKEVTRDNLARVDYTDGTSSLLAEPQRTNLLKHSSDFSSWNQIQNITFPDLTTSPSGENDGTKFLSTSTVTKVRENFSVVSGTTYTFSFYCKNINATNINVVVYDGANFFSHNFTSEVNTSTWSRVSMTFTALNTSASGQVQLAQNLPNGESAYFWGAQLEEGSYLTSYIPTSGSTVTRNQDLFTRDGIGSLINSPEGVLFVEMAALINDSTRRAISLSDGTNTNRVVLRYDNNSNRVQGFIQVGGAINGNISDSSYTITDFLKIAFKWKAGDFALWINGTEVATSTGATSFGAGVLTEMQFNEGDGAGTEYFGKVKQLQVYKTALTDDELTILTGTSGVHFYTSYAAMASGLTYKIE